jgi:hypothetical protein
MTDLTTRTRFSGACPACKRWLAYTPLPAGRGHAYPPTLPTMGVTCRHCGAKATLEADAGQSHRQPLIIDRDELDLSDIRRHVREMHRPAFGEKIPRSNRDLAAWHGSKHHRLHLGHIHKGLFVLIRNAHGSTVGQIPRQIGNFQGTAPVTREELREAFLERHARGEVESP